MRHPMPYGDLERQAVQRFATLADLDAAALHHRGARGVRAAHRARATSSSPASTMRASSRWPRRRPTSSSGTAATTTFRSCSPTCTSSWSIRCGPGTRPRITRARPCCAWPTSSSSPRSTRRPTADIQRCTETRACRQSRAPRSSAPPRRSRLEDPAAVRGQARARRRGRARRSRMAAWPTAPATSRRSQRRCGGDRRSAAVRRRANRRAFTRYPHIGQVLPAHGLFGARSSASCRQRSTARAPMSWSPARRSTFASHAAREAGRACALRVRRGWRADVEPTSSMTSSIVGAGGKAQT